jgi:hypothetical protein
MKQIKADGLYSVADGELRAPASRFITLTYEATPAKHADRIVKGYSLWKQLIQKLLTFALLFQIIRGSFLDESLQVIGVLFHARQQVVQDVAALIVTTRKEVSVSLQLVQFAH